MEKAIFQQEHVFIDIDAKNQDEEIAIIAQKFVDLGYATNYKKTLKGLHKREKEGSTGFDDGIAIPHAKIKEIIKPGVFVFRFKDGIEWNSVDGSLVKTAIALAIPNKNAEVNHLKILSSIARKLCDENFRNALISVESNDKLFNVVNQVEVV